MKKNIASGLIAIVGATLFAAPAVQEEVLGPIADGAKYVVSPDGAHVAVVAAKGSRTNVVVDGVAGPRFDAIVDTTVGFIDSRPYLGLDGNSPLIPRAGPVTFSRDGRRYAYLARLGQEWVLMADNKEVLRVPVAGAVGAASGIGGGEGNHEIRIEFSGPDGKRLLFARSTYGGNELWVDGQKWPGFFQTAGQGIDSIEPMISPDGTRIVYPATMEARGGKQTLIANGKDAGFFGEQLQWTADGKHLLCINRGPSGASVLLDGKSIFTAKELSRVYVPPVGNRLIFAVTHFSKDGLNREGGLLIVDGKPVEATLTKSWGAPYVVFSPDGKRYAAVCGAAPNRFVVIDGKKGQEYFNINTQSLSGLSQGLTFSADSSKVAYTAQTGTGGANQFVIVNEEESDGFFGQGNYWFSPDGKHVAVGGMVNQQTRKTKLTIDGKVQAIDPGWTINEFTFSPDSQHHAYSITMGGNQAIYLDGKDTGLAGKFIFSDDGKHLAVWGNRPPPEKKNAGNMGQFMTALEGGLFVDGQLVYSQWNLRHCAFTPDGEHVFWTTTEPATDPKAGPGVQEAVVYLDGKQVARSDRVDTGFFASAAYPGGNVQFVKPPPAWKVGPHGALAFLAPAGDTIKRITITPTAETNLTSMIKEAAEAPAKAAAKAAEEKKKADEVKAARKAKADADAAEAAAKAKADYEAQVAANLKARADAQAKAKADYDARVAKQKSDYEALLAKQKAAADAAAAKQKK